MAKFQSPLLGYNNNVRHRGRIFHIQTEDSGVNHPHIITHLFMDGGRILKSVKKSYAEHVGSDNMSETVRVMMKEQHKAMFIALRDGQFDALVDGNKPGSAPIKAPIVAPKPVAVPRDEERSVVMLPDSTSDDSLPAMSASMKAAAKVAQVEEAPPPTVNEAPRLEAAASAEADSPSEEPIVSVGSDVTIDAPEESVPEMVAAAPLPPPPPAVVPPPPLPARSPKPPEVRRPSAAELTLDFDALERDTGVSVNPLFKNSDLPPPPAALFAKHEAGTYRTTDSAQRQESTGVPKKRTVPPPRPPTVRPPPAPSPSSTRAPVSRPSTESRYAPARPAAIFGASAKPSPSIFGDDLVSDKSLDEVILSYLAEDLDPPRRK